MPSATPSIPARQTAILVSGPGKLAIKHDVLVPPLPRAGAIIKVSAVAINPADAKMLDYSPAIGAIHGYDFAGTIVALDSLAPCHLAMGDRVAGLVHGNNSLKPSIGGFSEYVAAECDLILKLPDSMSLEEGATIGTGLGTALLCLFRELNVPGSLHDIKRSLLDKPGSHGEFVLVAGGATATGTRALQMLKLIGLRPIATCSPANFDLVLKFGAEKVFDYHDPDCAADIRAYTRNTLSYALDCVTQAETTQMCYGAIGRAGGRYVSLDPSQEAVTATRPTITPSFAMVLTMFGSKVALDGVYGREAKPEDREFANEMWPLVQRLLDTDEFWSHPVKTLAGGWDGVVEGVQIIRNQTMGGYKLVVSV